MINATDITLSMHKTIIHKKKKGKLMMSRSYVKNPPNPKAYKGNIKKIKLYLNVAKTKIVKL